MISGLVLAVFTSAGDAAFRAGDFGTAARAYAAQWRNDREDLDAAIGLARLALYANRLNDARRWLDAARRLAPNDPRVGGAEHILAQRTDAALDAVAPHRGPAVVPFAQTDPLPIVNVRVNGHPARFLIDTGAPNIVLDARFAALLGIASHGEERGTFAGGEHAPVAQGTVERLELGGWRISNVPASILPVARIMGGDSPVDGILGAGLFAHFLTTLDFRTGRLILRDPSESGTFETGVARSGATIVPMYLVGDHFIFVRGNAGDGPEGLLNVDTGGTFGVQLTEAAIGAAGIALESDHTRSGVGGAGITTFVPFTTTVAVGAYVRRGVAGVYTPQGSQYGIFPFDVTGTISYGFFRGTALTFDFRAMRMVIEPD